MTLGGARCYHAIAVNRDRALAIVASTGMILTWLANAASPRPEPAFVPESRPQAGAPVRPDPDAATALSFDVERETERLRVRVADAPAPRRSGRNPFRFAERAPQAPPARVRVPRAEPPTLSDVPPAAPPVLLKLIGVAERAMPDGTLRSAVLSGPADVFIVAVGDQVMGRFTVTAIAPEVVELADAVSGQAVRLAMR